MRSESTLTGLQGIGWNRNGKLDLSGDPPLRTHTLRRQTTFGISALSFLSIYIFQIEVTSLESVGVKVAFPSYFARTILFWVTMYLFARYALDLLKQVTFFSWARDTREQVRKHHRAIVSCQEAMMLMSFPVTERMVIRWVSGQYNGIFERIGGPYADVSAVVEAARIGKKDPADAVPLIEADRLHCLAFAARSLRYHRLMRFRAGIGFVPFFFDILLDVVAPTILFALVICVATSESNWLLYENLRWFWIQGPGDLAYLDSLGAPDR